MYHLYHKYVMVSKYGVHLDNHIRNSKGLNGTAV